MRAKLAEAGKGRLERSCVASDRIRLGRGSDGVERLEAHLSGQAYSPQRHDTYAIGITLSGVQSFRYRGERRQCLPGQCHILHPDELHDGGSATDAGFAYRIVYIDPALIQRALGGRALPFVADPVADGAAIPADLGTALADIDEDIDAVSLAEVAVAAADMLEAAAKDAPVRSGRLCLPALARVRELIAAEPAERHAMEELEQLSGLDRWTLARQFRAAFGTSPSRFRTMRRLDRARRLLRSGSTPAAAAMEAGFSDQSHMSRQFKLAYGMPPGRWASAVC